MSSEETTEIRLFRQWRTGDTSAGGRLLRRYAPMLQAFFRRKRAENVDELVQSTMFACIQSVARFEERSSFKSYLLGIARNQFLMSLRSHSVSSFDPPTQSTAPEDSPSQMFAFAQERAILLGALMQLPSEFRQALRLFYWEGSSVEEIGQTLGVPVGTVKSRLARGRSMLKQRLVTMNLPSHLQAEIRKFLDRLPPER
jgi:RNA polymerase sigma factor (sigma-70 family)